MQVKTVVGSAEQFQPRLLKLITPATPEPAVSLPEARPLDRAAMERLAKDQPIVSLTEDQKKQLAEIDSQFKARIAEKELFLKGEIEKAGFAGKLEEVEQLQKQLSSEIRRLQEDCEAKKEKLRASFGK